MIKSWKELKYFDYGEWDAYKDRLEDCGMYNSTLQAYRKIKRPEDVKVVIMGQDPYPNPAHCSGVAFSLPADVLDIPPTLANIFREYIRDLHYPFPKSGELTPWTKQGVMLWNAVPTCTAFKSMSHYGWPEWRLLTQEIVESLSGVVFVFVGSVAREFVKYVDQGKNRVIETSHPSPRGQLHSKTPFIGSRVFTTTNAKLVELGREPVDWRLDHEEKSSDAPRKHPANAGVREVGQPSV